MNRLVNEELSVEEIKNAQPDNEVIFYKENSDEKEDGKAIVMVDGSEDIYFISIAEEYVNIGDFIDNKYLQKIDVLDKEEQDEIRHIVENL